MKNNSKPIILTESERQAIINKIKNQAANNPEYAKHVEKRLAEIKERNNKKE